MNMQQASAAERVDMSAPVVNGYGAVVQGSPDQDVLGLDMAEVAAVFKEKGLLLFRDFKLGLDKFKLLTEALCGDFISYQGGASCRSFVNDDPTFMTVSEAKHSYPVPLHGEMYYAEIRPEVLWFYCVRPADEAGETTVGDGAWFYQHLNPKTRDLFENNKIRYITIHPEGRWQQLFQTEKVEDVEEYCRRNNQIFREGENGALITETIASAVTTSLYSKERVFINNALAMTHWEAAGFPYRLVRLEDGSELPKEVIEEMWQVEREATLPVAWQPEDVVMVDNTRFMHGRRKFTDMKREIYVRLAQNLRF
jgi:alpha-ketoglutarate-dependent taurine dioxygenase